MALVVEDGTGLATANSYISEAGADLYHANRGDTVSWDGVASKEALLVSATDFLKDASIFPWVGTKKTYLQGLAWPRTGGTERTGQEIPDNVVPATVADATADLALLLSSQILHPIISRSSGDVRKEKVDVLETEFFSAKFRTNNPEDYTAIVTSVMGMLYPLLRAGDISLLSAQPHSELPQHESVVDTPRPLFYDGIHDIP